MTATAVVVTIKILSAGGMARRLGFDRVESLTVGVGMCGRAEMAFVLASLGLSTAAIDTDTCSILIFAVFTLNLVTPLGLKACAVLLQRRAA